MRDGFLSPDWEAPLNPSSYIAAAPADATTKGMYFLNVLSHLQRGARLEESRTRYFSFKDYPLAEFMQLSVRAASVLYPAVGVREGLRRVGQLAYPTIADSAIGKVVFGVLGLDLASIMRMSPKGYSISLSHGRAEVLESSETHAVVRLTDVYNFLDSYHVGVFEGGYRVTKRVGTVTVRPSSVTAADFLCEWS